MMVTEMAATNLARSNYEVKVQTIFNKIKDTEVLNLVKHVIEIELPDDVTNKVRKVRLVNTILNLAAPDWKDLPKENDPAVLISILKSILEKRPPRATFKI